MNVQKLGHVRSIIRGAFLFALALSVTMTFYRYIIQNDFAVEIKPMEDFTDEDF